MTGTAAKTDLLRPLTDPSRAAGRILGQAKPARAKLPSGSAQVNQ
jgi:hypothetical protein